MERRGDGSKPGLSAPAEPRKTRTHQTRPPPPPPPLQTFRPLQGMRAAPAVGGLRFSSRQLTLKRLSSRSLRSRGAGEEGILRPQKVGRTAHRAQPETPAAPARLVPPPLQLGGAAASGTIPESTEDAEEAGGKQRLRNELQPQPRRASFAPLPRLTQFCALLLSLTFLHRLPGTSIPPSARGCRDPHLPERSRRRGRRGRDGKAGPLRAGVGARLRTHALVLVPPAWRVGRASEMGLELRYVGRGEPAGANLRPELGAGL